MKSVCVGIKKHLARRLIATRQSSESTPCVTGCVPLIDVV